MRPVLIAAVVGGLAVTALAQSAPDRERAKELYRSAETAMAAQDYASALRDYGAAYDLTKDPVLFYKIGAANERAGKCPLAVVYYRRYLAEASPTPAFVDITNARIRACESPPTTEPAVTDTAAPTATTTPTPPAPPPAATADTTNAPANSTTTSAKPATAMGSFVGSRDNTAPSKESLTARNRGAWLFVTGSIALVTVGAVLAYSADSAENDISDLYVGLAGTPPAFDRQTKRLYDDLVAEGQRYERLSWLSFGLAGVTAGVAGYLFWREHDRASREKSITVTPAVTQDGAGVRAAFSF